MKGVGARYEWSSRCVASSERRRDSHVAASGTSCHVSDSSSTAACARSAGVEADMLGVAMVVLADSSTADSLIASAPVAGSQKDEAALPERSTAHMHSSTTAAPRASRAGSTDGDATAAAWPLSDGLAVG